ncbi:MAG: UbiA prenyltransferase family protein [Euryarchaeota archaeon]|nr:UbiA prenyltransferase family protein [Euryarchaeota archaeon]
MIREYLKLARISIVSITGLAPVIGALATGHYQVLYLLLLFLIGFFGHAYGMTHNDLIDYTLDKKAKEIVDRPLVSGTISIWQAWFFALSCLATMFIFSVVLAALTMQFCPLILLVIPTVCVTLYNILSKRIPFADILLAIGMFFFILYGAASQQGGFIHLPMLVWIVCILGTIQMLSINVIMGGFKDVENDASQGARTGAMILGMYIRKKEIHISRSFIAVAYALQLLNVAIAYLPFFLIPDFASPLLVRVVIFGIITILGIVTIYITWKYLGLACFERGRIRKFFNLQGYINFTFASILLLTITPFALLIIPLPGIGFFLSTLLYHEKFMQPVSM